MASKSSATSLLKGRWTVWILAFVFALMAGFGVLTILGSASEQATYYVMAESVPAGTKLTDQNIEQVVTNADGKPATALSLAQLQGEPLYTNIPLQAGDVITSSVVGTGIRLTAGLPEDYVAASLQVEPQNAAAGKIRAGDYVDIAAVNGTEAKVVLHNVLVLDVNAEPPSISQAANAQEAGGDVSNLSTQGVPVLYTFAVSPQDFATLALLRNKDVYLAISQGVPGTEVNASVNDAQVFSRGPVPDADPMPVPRPTDDSTVPAPGPTPAPAPTSPAVSPSPVPVP